MEYQDFLQIQSALTLSGSVIDRMGVLEEVVSLSFPTEEDRDRVIRYLDRTGYFQVQVLRGCGLNITRF